MIDWRLSLRRFILVVTALLCATPLVRPSISSALVTRGDAMLYAHDPRAQEKYRLALTIDPGNADAADRFVFAAFLSRKAVELEAGVQLAAAVLAHDPKNANLRMDRALCLQLLKRYVAARADFEWVGRSRGDVQALALAAADARKSGRQDDARRLLLVANRIDPTYVPVRLAIARSRK